MSKMFFQGIKIAGISCAVPENIVPTTYFQKYHPKEVVENMINSVGVEQTYRTSDSQCASDLCFAAAEKLLNRYAEDIRSKVGLIVLVTQCADYPLPATACVLQHRLGLSKDCMAFDVNLGCSGYVYGVAIAASMLQCSDHEFALVLAGDTCSKTAPESAGDNILFGDAGSATLLQKDASAKPFSGVLMTDGSGYKYIIHRYGGYRHPTTDADFQYIDEARNYSYDQTKIEGADVFTFSIREAPKAIKKFMEDSNKSTDDYDALILHQANLMIVNQIMKKVKFPQEKVPTSLKDYGNTSSASIPVTICNTFASECSKNEISILACGFGVGLSWGAIDMHLNPSDILPIFKTSVEFKEE